VVSVTDPYGRILGFLDSSRYFLKQVLGISIAAIQMVKKKKTCTNEIKIQKQDAIKP
jgi:hypothetical protein